MGQLWLQEEVRSLEQRVSTVVSPLLVPDASALLRHLPQAKQLAASRQFVIVVPISGQHTIIYFSSHLIDTEIDFLFTFV